MSNDEDKYLLEDYKPDIILVRKDFLPLIVCPGKWYNTYYYTIPRFKSEEMNEKYEQWFRTTFMDIVTDICKKLKYQLPENQQVQDIKRFGWYLPLQIHLEILKMYAEDNIPIVFDILRPTRSIYKIPNNIGE